MSGIGFSELLVLFLLGLIVLGPEKLPRVANQLGSWLGQARRMTRVMKRQLEEELDLDDNPLSIKKPATLSAPHDDDTYSPMHDEPLTTGIRIEPEVAAEPDPETSDTETSGAETSDTEEKKDA